MAVIDVGSGATNQSSSIPDRYTIVDKGNTANGTGTIDYVSAWIYSTTAATTMDFASFYVVSGNNLSTRGYAQGLALASGLSSVLVEFSAPTDFTAFNINTGDYIGAFMAANCNLDMNTTGGSGIWYVSPTDNIPCTNAAFSFLSAYLAPFYATGVTSGGTGFLQLHPSMTGRMQDLLGGFRG